MTKNSNLPILWQNALGQYSTEIARKAWLWFAEAHGSGMQYAADTFAREVEKLVLALRPTLATAMASHTCDAAGEVIDDLMRFVLTRHANWRLGGNVVPAYLGGCK